MSLQVWLPLNGDLNNYGVNNPVISGTASYASDGKIGSKSLNTSNMITVNLPSIASSRIWSVTFWAYAISANITTNWTRVIRIADGGDMFRVEVCPSSYNSGQNCYSTHNNAAYKIAQGSVGSPSGGYYDQWFHMAITCDGTTISVYHNGTLRGTQNYTGDGTITGSFYLENNHITKKNDFRIYNHCLSPKEVKEISKGLVCHYPLDNNGSGMPNLVNNSNTTTATVFQYHEQTGGSSNSIEMDGSIPCVKITRNSTAHSGWAYLAYEQLRRTELKTSTTYTISFDVKASGSGSIGMTGFVNGNATNYMTNSTKVIQGSFVANQWSHIILQATTIASFADITVSGQVVYMSCGFLNTVNVWMLMKNFRVTEGSNESPWSPSVSDASYSIFSINSNKEIDISGYGHHGTVVSSLPALVSNSARYSCVYNFVGSINNAFINTTTDLNFTDNFSWACWVKTNYTGTTAQYAWTVGRADAGGYGYGLRCASTTTCDIRFGNKSYSIAVTGGSWTHLAFTKNDTAIKIYKNGELANSYTFDGTLPTYSDGAGVGIGCFHYASGNIYPYYGSISDFRIYATALSADDVKQLYQASVSIDNNGNVFCSDIQEV